MLTAGAHGRVQRTRADVTAEPMGITLHAQVEQEWPAIERYGKPRSWSALSRWELNKDHDASDAMYNCPDARRGWPKDACFDPEELAIIDQGLQCIDGDKLPLVS